MEEQQIHVEAEPSPDVHNTGEANLEEKEKMETIIKENDSDSGHHTRFDECTDTTVESTAQSEPETKAQQPDVVNNEETESGRTECQMPDVVTSVNSEPVKSEAQQPAVDDVSNKGEGDCGQGDTEAKEQKPADGLNSEDCGQPEAIQTDAVTGDEVENAVQTDAVEEREPTEAERDEKAGWIYVLGHNKLKKKTLKPGDGHTTRPTHGQIVTMRCSGSLDDGTKVDCHDTLSFHVGEGDIVQALDLCTAMTELFEVALIVTDAQYAYGELGREPDIPSNASISYEMEILRIEDQPDYASLPVSTLMEYVDQKRERGNVFYSRKEYASSINVYTRALKMLEGEGGRTEEEPKELQKLIDAKLKCYNNLAAAQLKVDAWDAAIKSSDEVLKIQPENVKALFRKGKCFSGKGSTNEAIACLRKAIKVDPSMKIIHDELARLLRKQKNEESQEKKLYAKMFGAKTSDQKLPEPTSKWPWYVGGAVTAAAISIGMAVYRYNHW